MVKNGHSKIFSNNFPQKDQNKFRMAKNGHSKFFLAIFLYILLIECNGLESNEIYTFLDFYSEI